MEEKKCQNVYKITKVFSVIIMAISILGLIIAIFVLTSPAEVQELSTEEGITNLVPFYEIFAIYALVAIYFLIGGIGLWKLKEWAVKMIYGLGLILFASRVVNLFYYGKVDFEFILILLVGVFSYWLYRNRSCFNKNFKEKTRGIRS